MPNDIVGMIGGLPVQPFVKDRILAAIKADKDAAVANVLQSVQRQQKIIDTLNAQLNAYRRVIEDLSLYNAGMRRY